MPFVGPDAKEKAKLTRRRWVLRNRKKANAASDAWKARQVAEGLCRVCRQPRVSAQFCQKHFDMNREYQRLYWARVKSTPEGCERIRQRSRKYIRRRLYGLTAIAYQQLLNEQNSRCAICDAPLLGGRNVHVDHDHITGLHRGVLCNFCNHALGCFRDNVEVLQSAIDYLNRWRGRSTLRLVSNKEKP